MTTCVTGAGFLDNCFRGVRTCMYPKGIRNREFGNIVDLWHAREKNLMKCPDAVELWREESGNKLDRFQRATK